MSLSPQHEQMSLGSPSQSPPMGSQYLPQFLQGDFHSSFNASQINSRNSPKLQFWPGGNVSPPRSTIGRSFSMNTNDISNKFSNLYTEKTELINHHHHHHHNVSQLERSQDTKFGAPPPTNRLIDLHTKPTPNFNDSRRYGDQFERTLPNITQDISYSQLNPLSPPSPTQIDRFYTHGESIKVDDSLDETWVTVFGFPPSSTSYILQDFSLHGQILKYIPNTKGNWMHIRYQTKLHARKALSKNGKILADSIMIGVLPCIDKEIMQQHSGDENLIKSSLDVSIKSNDYLGPPSSKLSRTQSLRSNIRPLGVANRDKDDDGRLPRKNPNIISKAMEYMFGW